MRTCAAQIRAKNMAAARLFSRQLVNIRACFRPVIIQDFCRTKTSAVAVDKTSPAEDNVSAITSENDPNNHSNSHLGYFYTIDDNEMSSKLNYCLPKRYLNQKKILGDNYVMVRKPAVDVIQQLKQWTPGQTNPKFVFYGEAGCGKTLSLAHVVHSGFKAGCFVLLVPSVFQWVHSKKGVQMSKSRDDRFDQPEESAHWLKMIREINIDFLSKIETSQNYTWGKLDSTKKGTSLLSVIDQGLKRINYAPDVVGVVLRELRKETSLKVLFAVDEFNGFFGKTSFKDSKEKWIQPKNLSLVHHFTKLLHPEDGLNTSAMVFALSRTGIERNHSQSYEVQDLLGQGGESSITPFTSAHVPEYSTKELETCLNFYHEKGGFTKELSPDVTKEISMLSGNRGHFVSLVCAPQ